MINSRLNIKSLIAIGVGTIMGSGWMFSAQYTSEYAGPAWECHKFCVTSNLPY